MEMNFLIIGNGFDLAHGLQTGYVDFLRYCECYNKNSPISSIVELNKEFDLFIENNMWLRYFLDVVADLKDSKTWIDFEKEIAEIIQSIESGDWQIKREHYINAPSETTLEPLSPVKSEKFLRFISNFSNLSKDNGKYTIIANDIADMDSFVKFIYLQLRSFTRAFELYCLKINQTVISEPIIISEHGMLIRKADAARISSWKRLRDAEKSNDDTATELKRLRSEDDDRYYHLMSNAHPIDYLSMGKFSFVLSFNYTNTYERLYGDDTTKYCYIHGKAQENSACTNLILGIDDSLPNGDESSNFQCVRFKKYYQRILFKTGAEYKDWLAMGPSRLPSVNYVHIVGHSLDRTDHDVLYEFFSDSRFKIIVYYYNDQDFEEKIQNVIRLLAYKGGNGRDELIKRVHGKDWSIKFAYQYDVTNGLFKAPTAFTDEFLEVDAN